ncbi:MAG TPA: hypothetical protein VFX31_04525, partial [Ktedonobacterales bacterium]|nr:hypothetical protein [Ktedonobacterales bacterium]
MDPWTPDPNPDPNADTPDESRDESQGESRAASADELPQPGYEQPSAPDQPIGDEMAESEGGPFTGHSQPIGNPGVEEGEPSSEASREGSSEAPETVDQPAEEAPPAPSGLRIEIDQAEGDLMIVGGAEQITVNAPHWSSQYDAVEYDDGVRFTRLPSG